MNKQELARQVAQRAGLESTAQAKAAIEVTIEELTRELVAGGTVQLRGFGTFSVAQRAARSGRNPRTGAAITIKARKAIVFKAGQELKQAANSSHFGLDWLDFKDISRTVGDLKSKIEARIKNPEQLGQEARKVLDGAKDLVEDAGERLKKATDSGGKAWGEVKTGLDKALAELKVAWKKAKDSFD